MDEKQSTEKTKSSSQSEPSLSSVDKGSKHNTEKDQGIQWGAMRDLIEWKALRKGVSGDDLIVKQNESFDKCRIEITREYEYPDRSKPHEKLTKFIRRHRR